MDVSSLDYSEQSGSPGSGEQVPCCDVPCRLTLAQSQSFDIGSFENSTRTGLDSDSESEEEESEAAKPTWAPRGEAVPDSPLAGAALGRCFRTSTGSLGTRQSMRPT